MKKNIVLSYDQVTISDCRKMSRAGAEIKVDADEKTVTIDISNITYFGEENTPAGMNVAKPACPAYRQAGGGQGTCPTFVGRSRLRVGEGRRDTTPLRAW